MLRSLAVFPSKSTLHFKGRPFYIMCWQRTGIDAARLKVESRLTVVRPRPYITTSLLGLALASSLQGARIVTSAEGFSGDAHISFLSPLSWTLDATADSPRSDWFIVFQGHDPVDDLPGLSYFFKGDEGTVTLTIGNYVSYYQQFGIMSYGSISGDVSPSDSFAQFVFEDVFAPTAGDLVTLSVGSIVFGDQFDELRNGQRPSSSEFTGDVFLADGGTGSFIGSAAGSVPEPSSTLLSLVGAAALLLRCRRK